MTNDEKRALIEAATPGPWYIGTDGQKECWCRLEQNDAEFIVAARTEWPKDLERLEKLGRENAELRRRLERMVKVNFEYYRQIKSLKELLKDLQWDVYGYCSICGKGTFEHPEYEHYSDCKLAALLREG